MCPLVEGDTDDRLIPQTAFQLLGHEVRIEILWALWRSSDGIVTFSELRDRVSIEDSGRLNYHRAKLTGHFIEPVADGEGYTLRQAGHNVVRAIHAGTFTDRRELDAEPIESRCFGCDSRLRLQYTDGTTSVFCPDCGALRDEVLFPPGGLTNRDANEIALTGARRGRQAHSLARQNVCPACGGRITATLVAQPEAYFHHPVHTTYDCPRCAFRFHASLGEVVLDHPAVVSLFYRHGSDLRAVPRWELAFPFDTQYVERLRDDPLRGRVSVPCEEERLELTLDETGTVIDVEQRD